MGVSLSGCPGPLPCCPCGKSGVCPALRLGEEAQKSRAGGMGPRLCPRAGCSACWASCGLLCRSVVWCSCDTPCAPGRTWTALCPHSVDGAGGITGGAQEPGAPDSAGGLTRLDFLTVLALELQSYLVPAETRTVWSGVSGTGPRDVVFVEGCLWEEDRVPGLEPSSDRHDSVCPSLLHWAPRTCRDVLCLRSRGPTPSPPTVQPQAWEALISVWGHMAPFHFNGLTKCASNTWRWDWGWGRGGVRCRQCR